MSIGIYAITKSKSLKVYIGSTVNLCRRHGQHFSALRHGRHRNRHLQRAWDKYGEDIFEFGVLECLEDTEELHLAEQFWMDVYREEGRELYNFGLAARNSMLGRHHSEKTRLNLSEMNKGHKHSKETRYRISQGNKGHKRSEETRRRMSEAQKGRTLSDEHRRKLGKAQKGRKATEETRRGLSEMRKGNEYAAGLYPAFIHQETGETIPMGVNLTAMCRRRGLDRTCMGRVKDGRQQSHRGWILLFE